MHTVTVLQKKVLVSDDGTPVICGYGMSKTLGQPAHTTSLFSSSIRFVSPECFSVEASTPSVRMTSRDVYSFSMVALEVSWSQHGRAGFTYLVSQILSGLEPFHHLSTENAVFMHILRGERPIRTHLEPQAVTNRMWRLFNSLWDQNPLLRPEMSDVVASLVHMCVLIET